jgi:activating signal cointegrator 1
MSTSDEPKIVMQCLSLWQPWASLVFGQIRPNLFKQWETRSWATNHRGSLLIHAAQKHFSEWNAKEIFRELGIYEYFHNWWYMPYGAILGSVSLNSCEPTHMVRHRVSKEQLKLGDFSDGRFAWGLSKPVLFEEPIPQRGKQGLFWVELPSKMPV